MKELGEALPWVAFWLVVAVCVYVSHVQYMAGHDTAFFFHKTPEEQRLREAAIRKAEKEASVETKAP